MVGWLGGWVGGWMGGWMGGWTEEGREGRGGACMNV